jgi:hypothetical protein
MKVLIQEFGLDLEVKTKGLKLEVRSPDGKNRLGDIQITKTGLIWCNGKAHTGPKATWQEFIDWMNEDA